MNSVRAVLVCSHCVVVSPPRRVSRPESLPQREQRASGNKPTSAEKRIRPDWCPHTTSTARGDLCHNLIFLTLAAFNLFLQMATTVGGLDDRWSSPGLQ